MKVKIPSMSYKGWVKSIEDLPKGISRIENFKVELSKKTATIEGKFERNEFFERSKENGKNESY